MSHLHLSRRHFVKAGAGLGLASYGSSALALPASTVDARAFGAQGDGRSLDTEAVNKAIAAMAAKGGGTVRLSRGTYLCHSIHLASGITLYLDEGATVLAAPSGRYDPAEPNPWSDYQDFGHSHFHNSLIWGEDLHDVAIRGPGLISGRGLSRDVDSDTDLPDGAKPGVGNKAIALKNCANVTLSGFSILLGGHFGVLATGVDTLTIENLTVDTNRDGIDVDCCRDVRISGCRVNSPYDDSICLKSSYALGQARATERVVIDNCYVTGGFHVGTMLDGSKVRFAESEEAMMGRIKLGSESNGGFRDITINNCVFEHSRGLTLEAVDGGVMEDVTATAITMRHIRSAPVFLRLGARLRGPKGAKVGAMRRISVIGLRCEEFDDLPAIISGIPGHPVEDVTFRALTLRQKGGGSLKMAAVSPPEMEAIYPEESMFGNLPAQGLFARHVRGLDASDIVFASNKADLRPFIWLRDVEGEHFSRIARPAKSTVETIVKVDKRQSRRTGA